MTSVKTATLSLLDRILTVLGVRGNLTGRQLHHHGFGTNPESSQANLSSNAVSSDAKQM